VKKEKGRGETGEITSGKKGDKGQTVTEGERIKGSRQSLLSRKRGKISKKKERIKREQRKEKSNQPPI